MAVVGIVINHTGDEGRGVRLGSEILDDVKRIPGLALSHVGPGPDTDADLAEESERGRAAVTAPWNRLIGIQTVVPRKDLSDQPRSRVRAEPLGYSRKDVLGAGEP